MAPACDVRRPGQAWQPGDFEAEVSGSCHELAPGLENKGPTRQAETRAAVEPLIAHCRDHTLVPNELLKVLELAPATSFDDWLGRLGVHRSDVDPTKLPFYVTFVSRPTSIPFEP